MRGYIRIAIISDLHTVQKGKSKRILSEAFSSITEHEADIVLSAGDNVNGGQSGEYETLQASISEHLGGIPFYAALGNHDYFANDDHSIASDKARKRFFEDILRKTHLIDVYKNGTYSICFQGIHIIFLDCINNNKNFRFEEETEKWLESELEKSREEHIHIIVNHLPLAIHNLGRGKRNVQFMAGNNKLQKLIDCYDNIIYISGHTHYSLNSIYPSVEWDENGNIYINASSVGNAQAAPEVVSEVRRQTAGLFCDTAAYKELHGRLKSSSMGLFLDIYENKINICGYNFATKEYIPKCNFEFELK